MSNRLSDRFKQGDESIMQMMARIQSEITTDSIADQWQSKLEEFGVVFSLSRSKSRRKLCLKGLLLLHFKASLLIVTLFLVCLLN